MRALLIDDERLARKELTSLLQDHDQIEIVGESGSADEAKAAIKELKPDLIFLDINMPGKNGFELLEDLESVPSVIFVTAYDEFAIKAFEVNALDYLLKPVDPKRLDEAIGKVTSAEEPEPEPNEDRLGKGDQIFIKDGEKCWFVNLEDIRSFESEGNYVRVYFKNFKPLILKSLNNLEKRLDQKMFFRANRKYIVNLKWIESIENWFNGGLLVTLKDRPEERIEISRRQAARFKDLMSL